MWPIFVVSLLKTRELAATLALNHSYSTNIGRIAILNAGGERAAKTAQSTYWSCHDSIRTQILNWSQRSAKVVRTIIWNRGPVSTRPKKRGVMSGPGNNTAKTERGGFLAGSGTEPNRTAGQNPDPLLTLYSRVHDSRVSYSRDPLN